MHGRVKSKLDQEQEIKEKKEEADKAKFFYDNWHEINNLSADVNDHQALLLDLSSKLLRANPDVFTLWDIRRKLLLNLKNNKEVDKESFQDFCLLENKLIETCLAINPKSYSCWHQRAWILSIMPSPEWANELSLCSKFLNFDERNFHCWDHRRFIMANYGENSSDKRENEIITNKNDLKGAEEVIQNEIDFTLKKIEQNFSNYSAWHYRSILWEHRVRELAKKLITRSSNTQEIIVDLDTLVNEILDQDFAIVSNSVYTDPYDQSAWYYLQWMTYRLGEPSFIPDILASLERTSVAPSPQPKRVHYFSDWFPNPNPLLLSTNHVPLSPPQNLGMDNNDTSTTINSNEESGKFVVEEKTRQSADQSAAAVAADDDKSLVKDTKSIDVPVWDGRCQGDNTYKDCSSIKNTFESILQIQIVKISTSLPPLTTKSRREILVSSLFVSRNDPALMILLLNRPALVCKYIENDFDKSAQLVEKEIKNTLFASCKLDKNYNNNNNGRKQFNRISGITENILFFNLKINHSPEIYSSELLDIRPVSTLKSAPYFNNNEITLNNFPSDVWQIRNMNTDWTSLIDEEYTFNFSYLIPVEFKLHPKSKLPSPEIVTNVNTLTNQNENTTNYEEKYILRYSHQKFDINLAIGRETSFYYASPLLLYSETFKYFNESFYFERLSKYQNDLEKYMSMCQELASIEPTNKWCRLNWIFFARTLLAIKFAAVYAGTSALMVATNNVGNPDDAPSLNTTDIFVKNKNLKMPFSEEELENGIVEYLKKLGDTIDVNRKGFYLDLRSKLLIEKRLKILALERLNLSKSTTNQQTTSSNNSLNLERQELTTIPCHFSRGSKGSNLDIFNSGVLNQTFVTLSYVNVSFNRLTSLKWCQPLCCLKTLIADDNLLYSSDGIQNCFVLQQFSIQNNNIKNVENLSALGQLGKLKSIKLKGNPICHGAHFPEDFYSNYPNTLGFLHDYEE